MTRFAADDVLDDGLDSLKAAVDAATGRMAVCEGQPATYSEASQAKGTGDGKVLAFVDNPDLTVADDAGAGGGRKCTISAASGASIVASGTADHIALISSVGSKLWFVTTCTSQALVSGGTVDIPAWKIQVKDPTAP